MTLNQPVNHAQPGPPSFAAHQYGPPAVGYAETSSDIQRAMIRMRPPMIGQPQEMAIGPPLFQAWPYVVKHPARTEMIVNEIAKLENELQARVSSCL